MGRSGKKNKLNFSATKSRSQSRTQEVSQEMITEAKDVIQRHRAQKDFEKEAAKKEVNDQKYIKDKQKANQQVDELIRFIERNETEGAFDIKSVREEVDALLAEIRTVINQNPKKDPRVEGIKDELREMLKGSNNSKVKEFLLKLEDF